MPNTIDYNSLYDNIHATCVEIKGQGVLILGPSGAGKSDLALRLIMQYGGKLVADDRVIIQVRENGVDAWAPPTLQGLLEVRGVGIIKLPVKKKSRLCLVVELVSERSAIERMPPNEIYQIKNVALPLMKIYPFEISAADKLVIKLNALLD